MKQHSIRNTVVFQDSENIKDGKSSMSSNHNSSSNNIVNSLHRQPAQQ